MSGFIKAFLILLGFSAIIIFVVLWFSGSVEVVEYEEEGNKEERNKKQKVIKNTNFTVYRDIVIMFNNVIQLISSIDEINILINNNAEVTPNILIKDTEYKSFDNLVVWKTAQIKKLVYEYSILNDYYSQARLFLPETTRNMFDKELVSIYEYIKGQK